MMISLAAAGTLHTVGALLVLVGIGTSWVRGPAGRWMTLIAFAAGAAALIAEGVFRAVVTNRAPLVGTYENTLVVAILLLVACSIILVFTDPPVRSTLTRLTAPWAILALAFGSRFSSSPLLVGVEGRGLLAYTHAFVGWLDFTVLIVGTMAALAMLLNRRGEVSAWQAVTTRMLGAGFVLLTATIASGAVLSFGVFGSWYQWQIVETLSAVLWLAYGFALHAFLLFGWRERRLAALTVAVLPLALATFWVWALYPGTYHYFERILGS